MRRAVGTAALGVLLVLVAGTFDAEALYVPGVTFVGLAVAASAVVLVASRGVTAHRTLATRRVVEDEPLGVVLEVRAGRWPLPTGVIADPLVGQEIPLLPGRRSQRIREEVRFARRGRRTIDAPTVIVRDPLGLASRTVAGTGTPEEVLVLPRVEPVVSLAGSRGDGGRRRGRPAIAAEVELDGVREHRPGTPASRIYWPALARGAGLMERRLRSESDSTPLVVLDARGEEDDVDAAVRAAASLAVVLGRAGGCAVLCPGDRRATALDRTMAGWAHLHARLALVVAGTRPSLTGVAARQGPVLYVAARVPGRPPQALEHAPAAGRVLVVPGTMPGRRPAFTVAGCHGYTLEARGARMQAVVVG
jgi:uncharacterized protein (DUF58 family)